MKNFIKQIFIIGGISIVLGVAIAACALTDIPDLSAASELIDDVIELNEEEIESFKEHFDANAALTRCADIISAANEGDMDYVQIADDMFGYTDNNNQVIQDVDGSRYFYENGELITAVFDNAQYFFEDGELKMWRELDSEGNELAAHEDADEEGFEDIALEVLAASNDIKEVFSEAQEAAAEIAGDNGSSAN